MVYSKRENAVSSKCPQFAIFISRALRKLSQGNFHAIAYADISA